MEYMPLDCSSLLHLMQSKKRKITVKKRCFIELNIIDFSEVGIE